GWTYTPPPFPRREDLPPPPLCLAERGVVAPQVTIVGAPGADQHAHEAGERATQRFFRDRPPVRVGKRLRVAGRRAHARHGVGERQVYLVGVLDRLSRLLLQRRRA